MRRFTASEPSRRQRFVRFAFQFLITVNSSTTIVVAPVRRNSSAISSAPVLVDRASMLTRKIFGLLVISRLSRRLSAALGPGIPSVRSAPVRGDRRRGASARRSPRSGRRRPERRPGRLTIFPAASSWPNSSRIVFVFSRAHFHEQGEGLRAVDGGESLVLMLSSAAVSVGRSRFTLRPLCFN